MDRAYGEYSGRTISGFIRYVSAKVDEYRKDISYKAYVTDCLSLICRTDKRWYDLITGEPTQEEKNQEQAEEIVKALRENFYRKEDEK